MLRLLKRLFEGRGNDEASGSWPFDQPENCAAVTTTHVMKGGADITHVSHDLDDHGWQFHYAGEKVESDAMVVFVEDDRCA